MIKKLSVRNYAIIEHLEIQFPEGLTIITGETGAGKSILMGALGLIMGERAETKVLFNESEKCVIEGVFDISPYGLQPFFAENDIDYDAECVLRRELTPSGKSRAFVNDTPVTLDVLRKLSSALVDVHQQFDTLDIHQVDFQLRMLDALAGNKSLLTHYQALWRNYAQGKRHLAKLHEQAVQAARDSDYLQFQLDELWNAHLEEDEQERLETELNRLSHAEEIRRTLAAAFHHLTESETPLTGLLKDVLRLLAEVRKYQPDLPQLYRRLESVLIELEDIATEFEKIAEQTETNPERIQTIRERLDVLYRLQNKHRLNNISELITLRQQLQSRLDAITDLSGEIEKLEAELALQEKELRSLAATLSRRRRDTAPRFAEMVAERLTQLAMPHARFEAFVKNIEELSPTGLDEVSFLFSANAGTRLQPIKDIASGGELSRLTLVTKSLVANAIPLPTLIFDEIDAGVSGDVSLKIGHILRQLSNHHQVVVITHSPQVAAGADAHYFVYKKTEDNSTSTKIRLLNDEERIRAIAVMLSQNPPSEAAIANARELMLATSGSRMAS